MTITARFELMCNFRNKFSLNKRKAYVNAIQYSIYIVIQPIISL